MIDIDSGTSVSLSNIVSISFQRSKIVCRFDTIKVRLQTSTSAQFKGPLECLMQTVRKEGILALYKGASPPLVGWMFMDSLYGLLTRLMTLPMC